MGTMQGQHLGEHLAVALRQEVEMFDRSPTPLSIELTELSAVLSNADYAYIGWMDFNRLCLNLSLASKRRSSPAPRPPASGCSRQAGRC